MNRTAPAKLGFMTFNRRFVSPLAGWYLSGAVALAAVNLVNLEIPQLAKEVINSFTAGIDPKGLTGIAITIAGLGVLLMLTRAVSRILIFWPGRRLETTTKQYLFERAIRLPEAFFLKHGMGDLISRLANDLGQIRAFYAFGVLQIANVIFLTAFTVAKMVSIHATLTALALAPLALMLLITKVSMPKMHFWSRKNQEAIGALTNRVTEAFVNVHVIQANAAAPAFAARAETANSAVYETNMKLVFVRTLVFPMMTCLAGLSQLAILAYGGHEVIAGRLTVGDILAFNVYIGLLVFPLTAIGIILSLYQRCKTALDRIGEIESSEPEKPFAACGTPRPEAPLLAVKGLTFSYPTGEFRLAGPDLELTPGRKIGIFGRVGAGKSTLFHLLTRLYDPPRGTVFWRGLDVLDLPPPSLRHEVGYALQQVHLFSDTIRANLVFGLEKEPSEAELEEACGAAQILEEIHALKDRFATEIGEKGVRLSGGQKQRLALARLLLRKPDVLLLDDVLSAVDHATEKNLIDAIHARKAAMIIASHRGSALKRCDEVIVLGNGGVLARGAYAEIVAQFPELRAQA